MWQPIYVEYAYQMRYVNHLELGMFCCIRMRVPKCVCKYDSIYASVVRERTHSTTSQKPKYPTCCVAFKCMQVNVYDNMYANVVRRNTAPRARSQCIRTSATRSQRAAKPPAHARMPRCSTETGRQGDREGGRREGGTERGTESVHVRAPSLQPTFSPRQGPTGTRTSRTERMRATRCSARTARVYTAPRPMPTPSS